MVDFTDPESEAWWRAQAVRTLRLGVEGIKADDGEGYYVGEDLRFADGTTGAQTAWRYGGLYRRSMQRALDDAHGPGRGVLFGRSGWSGQQADGMLWAGDQASDFWSLRTLVASSIAAAGSGFSNWSHDVGGYLGYRLVERCPKELLLRWVQLGAFTPLMQAHGRLEQEPWTYDRETLELYRGYVLLHEMLNPYLRAAAASAARGGPPILRPASLLDPGGWEVADAFGVGPALWVAPVVEEGARERDAWLPPGDWIEAWSGARVRGGREVPAPAPLHAIPVWVRAGAIVVTHPAESVRSGLGEGDAPLHATLWGEPRCGRALARLADGTVVRWVARALVGPRPRRRDLRRALSAFDRVANAGRPGFSPWTYRSPRKLPSNTGECVPSSASPPPSCAPARWPRWAAEACRRTTSSCSAPPIRRRSTPPGRSRSSSPPSRSRPSRRSSRASTGSAWPAAPTSTRSSTARSSAPPSSAPPTPPTTPSSSPSPAPPTPPACRCSASAAARSR